MTRLLALEFARLSRQVSTYVLFTIILLLGGFNTFVAYITQWDTGEGVFAIINARTILETSFQLGQFQLLLIGVLTSLFIASDINQGTIRNKILAGYTKFEIYVTAMVMSMMIAVSGLLLFHALPSIFSSVITFPITADDGGSLANFFITMGFGYGLVIVGVLLTTWMALRTKSTAGAIIFTLLIFVLGPSITTLIKTIIEAVVLINYDAFLDEAGYVAIRQQIDGIFEFFYFYQINRLNNIGSLLDFLNPDSRLNFFASETMGYIWKTIGSNLILIAALIGLGGREFARSDLK